MAQTSAPVKRGEHVHHHFVDNEQQHESSKMGMWIFLVTEVLFFGGLFLAYLVFRSWYPELFIAASDHLDYFWGTVNTVVLIGSSLTIAMAIRSAQLNQQKGLVINLFITVALACVFMVIKYFEYTEKFAIGIFPGAHYTYEGIDHELAHLFFSIYYMMTGLHGLHVLIGIGLILWIARRAMRGEFNSEYYGPVEVTGLYWHLVDLIWIFLFPLLYLID